MPSGTTTERLLRPDLRRGSVVREFLQALKDPHTYSLLRNTYARFGLLWGLPIPALSIVLHVVLAGETGAVWRAWPVHVFFLFHPLFFAVIFGAMGTVRQRKDGLIGNLIEKLRCNVDELASANSKLKDLDRLKAEFMANLTHELKTPLVAIRGYNEAILEGRFGPLTDRQRDGLAVAVRNVDRLQKLIEELLEFERIDSGALRIQASDFDLVPVVHAALRTFQPHIDEKRLAVRLQIPESLPVRADREKISRVLLNLISNAVKFSPPEKEIGIELRAERGKALVTVWDRGPGIPPALQHHLFTRFWQADGSARRRHGGTGLGLAICKGVLDAHGSTIRVESEENAGTKVHFDLPARQQEAGL